jgi:S-DNA-T family DNA segregation ATPase FtsK/SpoIIIE
VGRDSGCELPLTDPDVSRRHLELQREGCRVQLRDLQSKNGVLVDGRSARGWTPLQDNGEIQIGGTVLVFHDPTETYLSRLSRGGEAVDTARYAPAAEPAPDGERGLPRAADPGTRRWDLPLLVAAGVLVLGALAALLYLLAGYR